MSTEVKVSSLPKCDYCTMAGKSEDAAYDGKTKQGPWANMCQKHFKIHGVGLGTGRGQALVVENAPAPIVTPTSKVKITMARVKRAVNSGEYVGFCKACGRKKDGVEPDARGHKCPSCGEFKVYGAEELLMELAF